MMDRLKNQNWLRIGFLVMVAFGVLNTLRGSIADPDLFGYLAFGRLAWTTGHFPYQDIFAYTPTLHPWVYHEWLTGWLYWPYYQAFGMPGLQVLKYVLGLSCAGVIYHVARKRGASVVSSGLMLWLSLMFVGMGYNPVRAQCWTFLFFVVFVAVLENPSWWKLSCLPLIMAVWANMHGGFVVGLGTIGIYLAGTVIKKEWNLNRSFGLTLFACALATCINPYGPVAYWEYIIKALWMPRPEITEWVNVWISYKARIYWGSTLYFLILAAFTIFLMLRCKVKEVTPLLFLGITMLLGMKAIRHQPFFMMGAAIYLPTMLDKYFAELQEERWLKRLPLRQATALILGIVLMLNLLVLQTAKMTLATPNVPIDGSLSYPVKACDFIQKNKIKGSMMVLFAWGEYCLWRLNPDVKVALDGRYETVYPDKVSKEYFEALNGKPKWGNFFRDYPPDMILMPFNSPLTLLLALNKSEPGVTTGTAKWWPIYKDEGSILFGKLKPDTAEIDTIEKGAIWHEK